MSTSAASTSQAANRRPRRRVRSGSTRRNFRSHTSSSTTIRNVGGNRYEVAGKLTLKGITHDCVVPITVADAGGNRVADGTFSINRLDYRIGEGEWADPSTVANAIRVHVRMVLPPA